MSEWTRTSDRLPPDGREVMTKIDDAQGERNVQRLMRRGNLWFAS